MVRFLVSLIALSIPLAFTAEARAQAHFLRGDSTRDGAIDISDGVATLGFLFLGQATPECLDAADVDDTGELDIGDAVNTFAFLFLGGRPPAAPFPVFEADPTTDGLDCLGTPVDVTANITADTTWTRNKSYRIVGVIFVKSPATLTIEDGVTVFGSSTSTPLGVLVAEKGAKIMAVGKESSPIVFTSEKPVGQRKKQDWGGVMLLGNADNNLASKTAFVEGLNEVPWGPGAGTINDAESSGQLSYVRIEFGGFALSPDNEVNGLGMFSVGSGTQLDHIMCKLIDDDAFEWFGGAANLKYGIEVGCNDDMFDTSFGTKGRGQFLVGIQNVINMQMQSNGFEMDNSEAPVGVFATDRPISKPTFSNVTLVGPGTPATAESPNGGFGMLIRRNTGARIHNFIVQGFRNAGIDIDDGITTDNVDTGDLNIDYGIFYQVGLNASATGDKYCENAETAANEETPANGFKYTSCSFIKDKMTHNIFATNPPTVNPYVPTNPDLTPQNDAVSSPFDPTTLNASGDSFFEAAPYYGAVAPGGTDWTKAPWISYQEN